MADRKKKMSGAQNRKRKAEKEKEQAKQGGSFLKYLQSQHDEGCSTSKDQTETEVETTDFPTVSHVEMEFEEETVNILEEPSAVHPDLEESGCSTSSRLNYSDPATWEHLDDDMRQILVEHGPEQVQHFTFPRDDNQRRFASIHYKRRLPNGEVMHRQWLQYSKSKDCVFCFCCKLFGTSTLPSSSLSDTGSKDWRNIAASLSSHERGQAHLVNYQNWKELEIRLKTRKTIDQENLRLVKEQEKYWQQILERLIALVRVIGVQNLALRGTHEILHTPGK